MAENNENKFIKFKFEVDNNSFAQVKQKIDEITRSLKELANVAKSVNIGTGGLPNPAGGGGGGLLSITHGHQQSGLPTTGGAATPAGVGGLLTQGLKVDAAMFRTIAEGSKQALGSMKDALRQTVQDQTRDIQRLKSELDSLSKSYNSLNKSGDTIGARSVFSQLAATGQQYSTLSRALTHNANTLTYGNPKTNASSIIGNTLTSFGMGGLGGMFTEGVSPAGIAVQAYKAWQYGSDAYYNNRSAVLSDKINNQLDNINQQARAMSSFGSIAQGIRGGDVGLAHGVRMWTRSQDVSHLLSASARQDRNALAAIQAGIKYGPDDIISGAKDTAGTMIDTVINGGSTDLTSAGAIKYKNLLNAVKGDQAEQAAQAIQAYANTDPMYRYRANEFYGGAMSKLGLQRAVGMSSVGRNGQWQDASALFEAQALNRGLDPGQLAGAIDAAKFSVGYRNRFKGGGFLSHQFGGFANAANTFAIGQEYGSGGTLVNAFAGRGGLAGRGGIDPLAASRLADLVTSQMTSSAYGAVNGPALAESLGSVVGMSGDVGAQLRLARQMQLGLGNLSQINSGQVDPLQQAINAYAGSKVFGGKFYQMNAVTQLSGGDLVSMLRNPKAFSARLSDLGITPQQLQQYASERDRFALARYHSKQGSSEMDRIVSQARAAGGPLNFIRNQLRGKTGRDLSSSFFNLTRILGGAEAAAIGGKSEEFIGGLRAQLGSDSDVFKAIHGHGAWDPTSRKGLEQSALNAQADRARQDAAENKKNEAQMRADFSIMGKLPDTLQNIGTGLMAGEARLEQALDKLAEYINVKILHQKPTPPPKPIRAQPPARNVDQIINQENPNISVVNMGDLTK